MHAEKRIQPSHPHAPLPQVAPTRGPARVVTANVDAGPARWEQIDRAIVRCGRMRAEHEAKEGVLLLSAKRAAIHKRFGFSTCCEYVEHRLGYDPKTTLEKLRVAEALERLPKIRSALSNGKRHFSCVRELVRVAVPETEEAWLSATENKTVRDVERLVSGRKLGDLPTDKKDPRGAKHVVRLELDAETYALFRETIDKVRRDCDPILPEAHAIAELCRSYLGSDNVDEGKSPYQVMVTKCPECRAVKTESRGESIEVSEEVGERIECDAQVVDEKKKRATQTIPPRTRRAAIRRARGACEVPGCRNRRWLEVHHKTPRSEGGTHHLDELVVLCGSHHRSNHDGTLWIEGDRTLGLTFKHADGTTYGDAVTPESIEVFGLAFSGLRNLGIPETQAKSALAVAKSHVGRNATLEQLIRTALKATRSGSDSPT